MTSNDDYTLEVLEESGMVSPENLEDARTSSADEGGTIVDALVRLEILSEVDILGVLAEQFGMDLVTLVGEEIPQAIIDTVPVEIARRYTVVPVHVHDDVITVAIGDPLDVDTVDNLQHVLKCEVRGVVAPPDEIKGALDHYYQVESSMEDMLEEITDGSMELAGVQTSADSDQDGDVVETDAPIIRLASLIILEAHRNRASDIHLEPLADRFRVRYRIDGVLHEVDSPPKRLQPAIISRIKLMASMKLSEKRIPQDGRIEVKIKGRQLDLRVSTVPTNHGESIVMRILDKQSLMLGLPALGFLSDDQATFERLLAAPDGILLVTGPTGSGKTTTLYACLNYINRPDRKIITVEDPIEYQLSGINQVMVRSDIGFTFGRALRAILRQAPNIIMIGEIRDMETATIATEASLTGHLVFSTLHTNDAPSAVARLLDIGIKPFLVASSIRAVMAQRLVRCVCEKCKEEREPTASELETFGADYEGIENIKMYQGRGCNECALTGYKGRKGIFEIFHITDEIQNMIFDRRPASELRTHAIDLDMRSLREDGLRKVATGMTTLEEVLRVTMGD